MGDWVLRLVVLDGPVARLSGRIWTFAALILCTLARGRWQYREDLNR
jgi:hypothetical protein